MQQNSSTKMVVFNNTIAFLSVIDHMGLPIPAVSPLLQAIREVYQTILGVQVAVQKLRDNIDIMNDILMENQDQIQSSGDALKKVNFSHLFVRYSVLIDHAIVI